VKEKNEKTQVGCLFGGGGRNHNKKETKGMDQDCAISIGPNGGTREINIGMKGFIKAFKLNQLVDKKGKPKKKWKCTPRLNGTERETQERGGMECKSLWGSRLKNSLVFFEESAGLTNSKVEGEKNP